MKKESERTAKPLVALIRGINVGGAKRVPMAELRTMMSEFGYGSVRTLLNSGNIVFREKKEDSKTVAGRIERGIETRFGVSARVTVLRASQIATVIDANPLLDVADDPSRLFVGFLADPESRSLLEPLLERDWSPSAFALGPGVAYLWCPEGSLSSELFDEFARLLKDSVTSRNWRTTLKIQAAVADLD